MFRKSPASILRWNSSFRKETRTPRPQRLFNCNPYTHFWQKCYMSKITNIHEDFFLCHQYSKQTVHLRSYLHNTNFTIWTSTQILSGWWNKQGWDGLGMQHNEKCVKSVLNFSWDTGRPVRGTVVHINMNPHKEGFEGVTRIHVVQNKVKWRSAVNTIMDLLVPLEAGKSWPSKWLSASQSELCYV